MKKTLVALVLVVALALAVGPSRTEAGCQSALWTGAFALLPDGELRPLANVHIMMSFVLIGEHPIPESQLMWTEMTDTGDLVQLFKVEGTTNSDGIAHRWYILPDGGAMVWGAGFMYDPGFGWRWSRFLWRSGRDVPTHLDDLYRIDYYNDVDFIWGRCTMDGFVLLFEFEE